MQHNVLTIMRNTRFRSIIVTGVIMVVIGGAIIYANRPDPIEVLLQPVSRGLVQATIANTRAGTVMACRRARLSPAIGGQIARLSVKEGERVNSGQLLLEMWNEDRKSEVELARRESLAAKARAEETCTMAQTAQREARRLSTLRKQGLASEETTDRALGDAKARRAACQGAQATAGVASARVDVAQALLEKTRLQAPFDGTVAEINGEIGEFVTPSPVGIPTPPAIDLVDNRCLYVVAPIDEVDSPAIRAGMPARITMDAFAKQQFSGKVQRVAPYVLDLQKQARTVDIEVEFDTPAEIDNLLPGYSADVEVILGSHENVLRIPTEGILEGNRILVYDPQTRRLTERAIETGLSNWRHTEVLKGVTESDTITTSLEREGVEDGALVEGQPQ